MKYKRKLKAFGRMIAMLLAVMMILEQANITGMQYAHAAEGLTAPAQDAGVYQIGSLSELVWFSALVNGDTSAETGTNGVAINQQASAKLTDDITISDAALGEIGVSEWIPIGSANEYKGKFDGANHTITFDVNKESALANFGLFGTSSGGSELSNLKLAGSINLSKSETESAGIHVGALSGAGFAVPISNVSSTVEITNANDNSMTGGLVGYYGGRENAIINHCFVNATITGTTDVGGMLGRGWHATQYYTIQNSLFMGTVSSSTSSANVGSIVGCSDTNDENARKLVKLNNLYYTGSLPSVGVWSGGAAAKNDAQIAKVESVTDTQLQSGEVAWKLNGEISDNPSWFQTFTGENVDLYPVLANTSGVVYQHTSSTGTTFYSNKEEYVISKVETSENFSQQYDGTAKSISVVKGGDFTWDGDGEASIVYYIDQNGTKTTAENSGAAADGSAPVKVGTYYVVLTVASDSTHEETSSDYVEFQLTKRDGKIENSAYGTTYTYNGSALTAPQQSDFTNTDSDATLEFTWYSGDLTTGELDAEKRLSTEPTDAGDYTLVVSDAGNNNYEPAELRVFIKVNKATPDIGTVGYTGTIYSYMDSKDVSLTRSDSTLAGTLSLNESKLTVGTENYTYSFVPEDEDNYDAITDGIVSLTVEQAAADEITKVEGSEEFSKVYTGEEQNPSKTKGEAFTWSGNGTISFTYFVDEDGTKTTSEDTSGAKNEGSAPVNAGTYYVKATVTASGEYAEAESDYYSFTIDKAEGTIKNKTEGGYSQAYTYTGEAVTEPTAANFECSNPDANLTYAWYDKFKPDKLDSRPINHGLYRLVISDAGNNNYTSSELEIVTIYIQPAYPNIGTVTYEGPALYDYTLRTDVVLTRENTDIEGTLELVSSEEYPTLVYGYATYSWIFTPSEEYNNNYAIIESNGVDVPHVTINNILESYDNAIDKVGSSEAFTAYYGDFEGLSTTKNIAFGWNGNGKLTIEYFVDQQGTKTTEDNSGASETGGVPTKIGTYYVKASVPNCEEYRSATSTLYELKIEKNPGEIQNKDYKNSYEYNVNGVEDPANSHFSGAGDAELKYKWYEGDYSASDADLSKATEVEGLPKEIGPYTLVVTSDENDYYTAAEKRLFVTIKKATPNLGKVSVKTPIMIYITTKFDEVELERENEEITGTLKLDTTEFTEDKYQYKWTFVPSDQVHYETVTNWMYIHVTGKDPELVKNTESKHFSQEYDGTPKEFSTFKGADFNWMGKGEIEFHYFLAPEEENPENPYGAETTEENSGAEGTGRAPVNAGSYVLEVYLDSSSSYGEAVQFYDFTITKAKGSIVNKKIGGFPTEYVYDGDVIPEPDITNQFTISNLDANDLTMKVYRGDFTDGRDFTDDDLLTGEGPKDAGKYTLRLYTPEYGNYTEAELRLLFTIKKATPNIGTVKYTGDPLYSYSNLSVATLSRSDKTVEGTLKLKDSTKLVAGTREYAWIFTPSGADAKNYETCEGKITLTVKAPVVAGISSVTNKLYAYNAIQTSWSKANGVSGYKVYYKTATAGSYTYKGTTTSTVMNLSGLAAGVKYSVKVVPYKTINGKTFEGAAKVSSAIYTIKKMATPKVSKKTSKKVTVKWSNIEGETGYEISKSTSKTKTGTIYTVKTTTGKSKVLSATKGKQYYYRIRAYKVEGTKKIYGPWSNIKAYKLK